MFLDKLKLQFDAFQQTLMGAPVDKATPRKDAATADYSGPQLVIGNELLITDDTVKLHRGLSNVVGRVVIIDEIPTHEGKPIKASAFGIQVNVDMSMAQHMRAAYVQREQA